MMDILGEIINGNRHPLVIDIFFDDETACSLTECSNAAIGFETGDSERIDLQVNGAKLNRFIKYSNQYEEIVYKKIRDVIAHTLFYARSV